MAGNRTELILSLINRAITDVEKGMEQSCGFVQESLLMRINDLKNRQERTAAESYEVNLDDLRKKTTPLLEDVDVELTNKKRYAALVELNIKAHYGYACVALSKLINSIKEVIVDNYNDTDITFNNKPVIGFRPHTLGGIRPPAPSDVVSCIEQKFKSLNLLDCLDSATVAAALESITAEFDNFHRENAINKAIDIAAAEEDSGPISRVVTLSGGEIRNAVLNGQDTTVVINSLLVSQRPAKYGVEWRPDATWRYPFENLWGDNKITIKTISTLLAKTIIPNVELSNFLLYMCNHIRAVIKSVKAILFSQSEASLYFQDETLCDWCAWIDLYNALEWFMLVARYIIYIYSKKETFLDSATNRDWCLLAAAVESIPPNLMSEDWVKRNLFSWPESLNNTKAKNVTEETILSLALRTNPGATHPVFGNVNDGDCPVTNRITVDSATFCAKVLLGRALAEEDAGTKMLVEARRDGGSGLGGIRSDVVIPLGVLPTEELSTKNAAKNFCSAVATASPFIASPTYLLRKIWNMESLEAAARRENNAIASAVLSSAEPLMFFDGGMADPGKEWTCLKMLGCCQAPTTIRDVWSPILGNVDDKIVLALSETMAERICKKEKERNELKKKASAAISSFLSGAISDINEANHSSSLAAVNALWSTLVWKAVTSEVLSRLSSFPDQKK